MSNWRIEDAFAANMAIAGRRFADALRAGQSDGGGLIWATPGNDPDIERPTMIRDNKVALRAIAQRAEIMARAVPGRDPCPRCGVRGEVGCKHRRNA